MMYRHMRELSKIKLNIMIFIAFSVLLSVSAYALSYSDGTSGPACPIHSTPLERCGSYAWYLGEDKALNSTYKVLSKSLSKNNLLVLRQAQSESPRVSWRPIGLS
jgi:hypothetical protein